MSNGKPLRGVTCRIKCNMESVIPITNNNAKFWVTFHKNNFI